MGDAPSRPAQAPPGAPTVGGSTLDEALRQIEEDRARAMRPPPPPPGVRGPPEFELAAIESDAQMAARLQAEEDAAARFSGSPAPSAPPPRVTAPAYYPPVPSAGAPAPPRDGGPSRAVIPDDFLRPGAGAPSPPSPPSPDADAALAARLQAEENRSSRGPPRAPSPGGHRHRASEEEDDFALARRLQEEEDASFAEAARLGPLPGPPSSRAASSSQGVVPPGHCSKCARPIGYFDAHVQSRFGRWHAGCFTCGGCGRSISRASGHAMKDGATPYHVECYRERFHPKCCVCRERIACDARGTVRWLTQPYWDTPYCPEHERDGTRRCDGCERMEPREFMSTTKTGEKKFGDANNNLDAFAELPDGRCLCLECASTAVICTRKDAPPLYDDVCAFMETVGLGVGSRATRPPLLLVAQTALEEADLGEGWHRGRVERTRGLCLFEERVVREVVYDDPGDWVSTASPPEGSSAGGGHRADTNSTSWWRDLERTFAGVGHSRPRKVERVVGARVNAVIVLYGLPAVAAGAVLAHECTHAHIRIAGGYPRLEPKVEEGLCQLVALLWVENASLNGVAGRGGAAAGDEGGERLEEHYSFGEKSASIAAPSPSPSGWEEANLAAMAGYVANQMRTDTSEVYGDGLRAALGAYQKHGLAATFAHVKATGQLPP